jgi:hypothetical protein
MHASKKDQIRKIISLRKKLHKLRKTPEALLPSADEELFRLNSMTGEQLHGLVHWLSEIYDVERYRFIR